MAPPFTLLASWHRGGALVGSQPTSACPANAAVCDADFGEVENDDDASFFDLDLSEVEINESTGGPDDGDEYDEGNCDDSPSPTTTATIVVARGDKSDGSKPASVHFPVSVLKSAPTRFRVFLLALRKHKADPCAVVASDSEATATPKPPSRKLLIISPFTKESSNSKPILEPAPGPAMSVEQVVNKYLSKIKPLYVRVSRRYGENLSIDVGNETAGVEIEAPAPGTPAGSSAAVDAAVVSCGGVRPPRASIPAGLKEVCKKLGKTLSASTSMSMPAFTSGYATAPRRDDSLLQQHDGIQSAIAHCKRSMNAFTTTDFASSSLLSMSNPGDGRPEKKGSGDHVSSGTNPKNI